MFFQIFKKFWDFTSEFFKILNRTFGIKIRFFLGFQTFSIFSPGFRIFITKFEDLYFIYYFPKFSRMFLTSSPSSIANWKKFEKRTKSSKSKKVQKLMTPFFHRTCPLLYHKFKNMIIFRSGNLYSLCSPGNQDYQKIIYFFIKKARHRRSKFDNQKYNQLLRCWFQPFLMKKK